ncbi:MAG TPA: DNA polymerase/3'-5' exonuclease PolX [Bryobacteraceae bacterium]|nr:DNA polymerase/3'-5' exonuclease PolX [Bryobacteraceae bacterium]HPQ15649.1 DNA polymerase/3'-5' exonuclease PolX [Bryobacteraceae bacterium]HPU73521.1 DNA polymerase/3'-5' exonuclease PolX [Bryobacteraceae bacterium]
MENRDIARLLSETADLMEIAGEDPFRIRSYRNAASSIESYPERVLDILKDPNRKVTDIPGIGKSMAANLQEIAARGSFDRRDQLLAKYPPTALELLKIQGLGPKTISLLWEHYRVSTIDGLERLCQEQKLRVLPRLGAKLEEKILRSICNYRQRAGRFLLNFADELAADLSGYLAEAPGVEKVTPAGSLRRGRETVGDLDLLVTGPSAANALDRFVSHPKVNEVIARGPNKASAKVGFQAFQVDVRALPRESYGAALQYFTGSKEHNIALRSRALKMGYTLSEYGLFRRDDNIRVAGETEEEVYAKLGLAWIPPELRENQGEIEAAAEGRLPHLVEQRHIRGDLHMHTVETDGRATLEEMAAAASALGYEYIAITDHSKALAMANGLDERRAVAFAKHVKRLNESGLGIHVFSGIECDIRRDGTMDLAEDALAELDLVIGSVHSYMNLEPAEMTDRLLRALECPYLRILGHPTGRLLLVRDAYPFDFDRVAAEAARRGVIFEINSSPERLDLYDALLRSARARGVRFAISTDAHHPNHLRNIRYGVTMARRGWLEPADVVNTLPLNEFRKLIGK